MANSSVALDTWQVPEVIQGEFRKISEILRCRVARDHWLKLQAFAQTDQEATLKEIPWNYIVKLVWTAALKESHMENEVSHSVVGIQVWRRILENLHLDTVDGLYEYVSSWAEQDDVVHRSIFLAETQEYETSDIGGWIADYMNTVFLVSTGRVRATVKYTVVQNYLYHKLSQEIGPRNRSPLHSGNAWEQLCWHAFEKDRGAFILAVIWHTTNRAVPSPSQTQMGPLTGSFQSLPGPPAPPPGPPPRQMTYPPAFTVPSKPPVPPPGPPPRQPAPLPGPPPHVMRSAIQPSSAIQQLISSPVASGQLMPPPTVTLLSEPARQTFYSLPRKQLAGPPPYPSLDGYAQAIYQLHDNDVYNSLWQAAWH